MNLRPGDAAAMGLIRRPSPYPVIDSTGRLERIELDARAKIRALRRDMARDAQAPALRRSRDPVAVEQARSTWRTEERLDALQSQMDWDKILTPGPWDQPGPVTRRVLEQSRIRMRTQERQRAVDARADALLPPPPAPPQLGSQPPIRLEPPPR